MKKLLFACLLAPLFCPAQEPEKFMSKPSDQWPIIALINQVLYKNGDSYIAPSFTYAGTGFLIDTGKDTLAATAKHILWIAKNKQSSGVAINAELASWAMRPKGNSPAVAIIGQLLNEDPAEILEGKNSTILERDWLVFSVQSATPDIHPLKPRYTAIRPGEKLFIISNAYADSSVKIFEGKLVRKLGGDLLIERNMADHQGGSSGSPVIDAYGYLVGVISSASSDPVSHKNVSIAISTEYLRDVLAYRSQLNTPKKDYGALLLQTCLKKGAGKAIRQYQQLIRNPDNYFRYNLRSANKNGLAETGQQLLEQKRFADAIEILEFNIRANGNFYGNYNLLAKAYLQSGDKEAAIKNYKNAIRELPDREINEAYRELEKLE